LFFAGGGWGVSCTTETTADGTPLVIKLMSRKNGTGSRLATKFVEKLPHEFILNHDLIVRLSFQKVQEFPW
jgi:hypothetical protein